MGVGVGSGGEGAGQVSFLAIGEFRGQLYSWRTLTVCRGTGTLAKCAGP
jgi:hypothetical protein